MYRYSICLHSIHNLHSELFLSGLGSGSAGTSVLCTSTAAIQLFIECVTGLLTNPEAEQAAV